MQVRLDRPAGAGRIRKKAFIQGHHAGQFGGKMPRVIDGQAAGISVQQLMMPNLAHHKGLCPALRGQCVACLLYTSAPEERLRADRAVPGLQMTLEVADYPPLPSGQVSAARRGQSSQTPARLAFPDT